MRELNGVEYLWVITSNKWGECASLKSESIDSSQSGKEFGWVIGILQKGYDYNTYADKLYAVATKRNKKNPEIYVKRTP
mgnify:CR=1 FL=1